MSNQDMWKADQLFELLKDYTVETDILDDENGLIQLEIYKDDITEFIIIPYELIKEIDKLYNIVSLSPQIKNYENEVFGSLVIKMNGD